MQQRLLVKFSCNSHNNILLRDLLAVFLLSFVLSGCHNNRTQLPSGTLCHMDSYFLLFYIYPQPRAVCSKSRRNYSWALGLRNILVR